MSRTYGSLAWVLLLAALAVGSGHALRAEDGREGDKPKTEGEGDKPKTEGERTRRGRGRQGVNIWTTDTINEKLGDQKLSDEQKTKVEAAMKAQAEALRGLRDATPEERREKAQAARKEFNGKMKEILTADQYAKWEKAREQRGPGREGRPGGPGGPRGERPQRPEKKN